MKILTQPLLDHLSIGVSAVCAIHCAAFPIMLVLFPALASLSVSEHAFHQALVWLIVPMSLIAAFWGCRRHKDKFVLMGISCGLLLLISTAWFAHDLGSELAEKLITMLATIILATAHWRNFLLCRKSTCVH
ncbi:hypothetical protein PSECIP111951_00548 [Pseudoalteromonas holothuriae]|uniref:MerC domain-containing protein n=1 Tax=Pseudoalteromonas holothuriae TaxID=2963714 RepID=A0A9W4QRI1_9GAMM|nr:MULTISPECIES: MerC domain-containing protein [unclassified Pseudoalteromonas]CAH9049997.1 hypothetical protein PSECIP111854_00444 [Pseudoalteromonas sp. CIP111854]CAH9052100.1 hypothetical protein PSECIP111951_00548 [Pseudoalteromonas sp. CIP111951]